MRRRGFERLAGAAAVALLVACAHASGEPAAPESADASASLDHDPWQPFNRVSFAINDFFDVWLIAPLAQGWEWITPLYLRTHLEQVFTHLNFPGYFLNDLLQGDPRQSGVELGRFLVNTTVGVAGFWDPAGHHLGWRGRREDFGQTLAVWGTGGGPYVVLPYLTIPGATLRDLGALPVDTVLNVGDSLLLPGGGLRSLNRRALALEDVRQARAAAFDWYVLARNAHLQQRERLIHNGELPAEDQPEDLYDVPDDLYELVDEPNAPSGEPSSVPGDPDAPPPDPNDPGDALRERPERSEDRR